MGCGMSLVKYLIFIFNFIFALAGLGLLVAGILIEKQVAEVSEFLNNKFHAPAILLIVSGAIIFGVAFFGCCGAVRESHCCIIIYVVLLLSIFVLQVVCAALAFVYRTDVKDTLQDRLHTFVSNYPENKDAVDSIQKTLKCCGYDGPGDYIFRIPLSMPTLPSSCCKGGVDNCVSSLLNGDLYTTGCKEALEDFIRDNGNIIGGVAIGVCVLELVGIVFALCLASSLRNEKRRAR